MKGYLIYFPAEYPNEHEVRCYVIAENLAKAKYKVFLRTKINNQKFIDFLQYTYFEWINLDNYFKK